MIKWTIYCHVHIKSGRRYVGLTKLTMLQRWNRHVYNSMKLDGIGYSHFANAIRKYGKDAFDHEVLETCFSVEEANAAEERWIEHFGTRDPEKGFNLAPGGAHTPHPKRNPWDQPGFRRKVSASMKKRCQDPAWKIAQSARSREINARPEVVRKQSEATIRQFSTRDSRTKMSEVVKALHRDPMIAARFRRGLETANRNRAARTHCRNGHEFTTENTRVDSNGWRHCRRCEAEKTRRRYHKRRAADPNI